MEWIRVKCRGDGRINIHIDNMMIDNVNITNIIEN